MTVVSEVSRNIVIIFFTIFGSVLLFSLIGWIIYYVFTHNFNFKDWLIKTMGF